MKENTHAYNYLLFLLVICSVAYIKPSYNWDFLHYTTIVLQYDHRPGGLHEQAYSITVKQLPAAQYQLLVNANESRKMRARDIQAFYRLLPFCVVKPFYTFPSRIAYCCGKR